MDKSQQLKTIGGTVIVLFIIFQIFISISDLNQDTPGIAACEFTKAYFKADKSMEDRICSSRLMVNGVNMVEKYIQEKTVEANSKGFSLWYTKDKIYDMKIEKDDSDKSTALKVTVKTKPPLKSFFTKEELEEEQATLTLIKEDGKWKVCGDLFDLPEA